MVCKLEEWYAFAIYKKVSKMQREIQYIWDHICLKTNSNSLLYFLLQNKITQ